MVVGTPYVCVCVCVPARFAFDEEIMADDDDEFSYKTSVSEGAITLICVVISCFSCFFRTSSTLQEHRVSRTEWKTGLGGEEYRPIHRMKVESPSWQEWAIGRHTSVALRPPPPPPPPPKKKKFF